MFQLKEEKKLTCREATSQIMKRHPSHDTETLTGPFWSYKEDKKMVDVMVALTEHEEREGNPEDDLYPLISTNLGHSSSKKAQKRKRKRKIFFAKKLFNQRDLVGTCRRTQRKIR